jgi:hypothetical protein
VIVQLSPGEVTQWFVAFYPSCANRWLDRLVPGRFKHVNAFGWSENARTWVLYEVGLWGTRVFVFPAGRAGERELSAWTETASILRLDRAEKQPGMWLRLGFWCVPATRHLLGLRGGALLPDGLWRDCLRAGAKVIHDASAETDNQLAN